MSKKTYEVEIKITGLEGIPLKALEMIDEGKSIEEAITWARNEAVRKMVVQHIASSTDAVTVHERRFEHEEEDARNTITVGNHVYLFDSIERNVNGDARLVGIRRKDGSGSVKCLGPVPRDADGNPILTARELNRHKEKDADNKPNKGNKRADCH